MIPSLPALPRWRDLLRGTDLFRITCFILLVGCSEPQTTEPLREISGPRRSIAAWYFLEGDGLFGGVWFESIQTSPASVCYEIDYYTYNPNPTFHYGEYHCGSFVPYPPSAIGPEIEYIYIYPYGWPWEWSQVEIVQASGSQVIDPYPDTTDLSLTCTPNPVTRGDSITCQVSVPYPYSSVTVSEWEFTPAANNAALPSVIPWVNPMPTTWGGTMAWSGTVRVSGVANRAGGTSPARSAETLITVNPRSWEYREVYWGSPVEISSALPNPPMKNQDLGMTEFKDTTFQSSPLGTIGKYMIIPSGPNEGYAYMLDMYLEIIRIQINRAAIASGSVFVNQHPTTQGTYCSRSTVQGLGPKIEKHEGTTWQDSSHTKVYKDYLTANAAAGGVQSVGSQTERAVGFGGVSIFDLVQARKDAAARSAKLADTTANNFQLPCSLKFTP